MGWREGQTPHQGWEDPSGSPEGWPTQAEGKLFGDCAESEGHASNVSYPGEGDDGSPSNGGGDGRELISLSRRVEPAHPVS